jgi:nucleoid DNA-binding protein/cell division septation protein DedD
MNLGNYISELLTEHETVIIPGFGAFLSAYKPATLDEETGEMDPPTKKVSFNSKIRHNDGLLVGYIAEKEGISKSQALKKIDFEREEILYRLDKGETVPYENLGSFSYDENREIQFNYSGKDNLLLDSFGLGAASMMEEPENVPQENQDKELNQEKEKSPLEKSAATKEPEPTPAAGFSYRDPQEPPIRKKKRLWWILLILIPIIAAGIYILMQGRQQDAPETVIETPQAPVTAPPDTTETEPEPVAEAEPDDEITDRTGFITPDPTKFYLISGSFEDFENANRYFKRLQNEGYEPFHLGKHGNFFLVGINVYDNHIEAYGQQYNYLDKYPDSGVWIFSPEENQ